MSSKNEIKMNIGNRVGNYLEVQASEIDEWVVSSRKQAVRRARPLKV